MVGGLVEVGLLMVDMGKDTTPVLEILMETVWIIGMLHRQLGGLATHLTAMGLHPMVMGLVMGLP